MYFFNTLFYINSVLLVVIIIFKTFHFFASTSRQKYVYWFYFSRYAIYKSRSEKTAKAKRFQNLLSFLLLLSALAEGILFLLARNPWTKIPIIVIVKDWFKLYSTKSYAEASIIKGMLEENNIRAIILNKLDSSYLAFGDIEVYVPAHLKDVAIHLMNNALSN